MGNTNEATENVNVNEEYTTKKLRRVLGKKELISMGLGQIIGSGVFSLTGVAIGFTGRSVVFAFLFGALFSLAVTIPSIFAGSAVRLRGGQYTMASLLLGERFSGFYIIIYIVGNISIGMYALSLADYLLALVPGIPRVPLAVAALTLFFVINLFGVKTRRLYRIYSLLFWRQRWQYLRQSESSMYSRDILREPSLRYSWEDGKDSAWRQSSPHLLQPVAVTW